MIKPILQLIRWQNLVMLCFLMYAMHNLVALSVLRTYGFGDPLPWWIQLMLTAAVVLIAAGGYVINDYFDIKIDRINRPERLIVSQSVSKDQAMRLFQVTTALGVGIGLAAAAVLREWSIATIFIIVPGMLWFYSSTYKRQLLIGNLIIAFAAAIVPIIIALANVSVLKARYGFVMDYLPVLHDIFVWLGGFALFAFLTTLVREIIKDLQDQMGDRELECHSLPIVIGETWTKVILTALIALILALIGLVHWRWLPYNVSWSSLSTQCVCFGLIIPLIATVIGLWRARIPSDYRVAQQLMKFCMLCGMLYSFVIWRML